MKPLLVLIHSPLVGPFTWEPLAQHLRRQEYEVLVPPLLETEKSTVPYWEQHARSVRQALKLVPEAQPLALVGHSGAGPLLPAIGMISGHPIASYLFVDASLPHGGMSQLAEIEMTLPGLGKELRADLEAGGSYPNWTDEDLRELVPDERARRRLLAEMHPRGLDFFTETLPVVEEWPDAPCAYLRFSESYASQSQQARRAGWPCKELDAGHFHMLVEPDNVAGLLVEMLPAGLTD